ncbi:hypothetical protein BGX28_003663 [Mortierella sp. GBA30]|nr:hypothetical protein BGX28_003663 [Mortierella sp. GBA30]
MADSKRLRVSKACDSCRRKKVKCGTYNDPTKKRGPPKGYIEAIEARLHRMEGLLGGLVKDKDPRAEIVRAELDAMAREAEMTGLKLRRSKAYEEINHAMAATSSSSSSSKTTAVAPGPSSSSMPSSSRVPPQPQQQQQQSQPPQQLQQQQQQQQVPQQHRQSLPGNSAQSVRPGVQQSGSAYRPNASTSMSDTSASSQAAAPRTQPMLQPSPVPSSRSNQYHAYDHPRHVQPSHQRPQHTLQHHHSQPALGTNSGYQKQHPQQHYTPGYGHSVYSSSQPSNFADNRSGHNHPGSTTGQSLQSHHPSQSLRERDHHRTSSGHSSSSNNSSFGASSYPSYTSNGYSHASTSGSNYALESHRIVTHRPSLTAHQLSNPLTGYMPMQDVNKEEKLIMPSIDVIDHLLDVHFRYVHPVLPMLHFRTISDQVHHSESPPSHLLFAILGLASRFSDNPAFRVPQPGVERPPCTIFYERAKYFIKDEYDNSQISTVQALLLMAVQQMGFCESQRAWLYVGMAIRMAQDLGLNKEPTEQEQARNRLQCELRKRTWWSIYVIERLLCAGLGRPLAITQKDCEAGYPQYEDDDREWHPARTLAARPTSISNFVHLITLSKIQGNILEYIKAKFSPASTSSCNAYGQSPSVPDLARDYRVDTTAAAFTMLDKSLSEWRQNLPAALQNPMAQSPQFGLFLHLMYNTLIILLHRPDVGTSLTSASLCTQAAESITDIIEILMDAKALTSMFISCLYAIFSAGVVHFMNVPSVKRSTGSSPVQSDAQGYQSSSTMSAKTNLKRCIDALKFLANHWVSAARRAKILEDLLDLKHVSLKDLEVDTFRMSPVGPSWALTTRYKDALIAPREGQDKLRQQCRSKAMAIHSLLANDEDYQKMQQRRGSSSFEDNNFVDHDMENGEDAAMDLSDMPKKEPVEDGFVSNESTGADAAKAPSPILNRQPIGLGVQSPYSKITSTSSPVSTTDSFAGQQAEEIDPTVIISDASESEPTRSDTVLAWVKDEDGSASAGLAHHENGLLTPMTMTTLVQAGASPRLSPSQNGKAASAGTAPPPPAGKQAMLDPFSMPSSISFPERNHDRRPSNVSVNGSASQSVSHFNTVWTTDSVTNRTTARSAGSSPMIPTGGAKQGDGGEESNGGRTAASTPAGYVTASVEPSSKKLEHEDLDLVWKDMPPTLGLDEWTAYIGAMMMRWLYASGHSSPRSTTSS